MIFSDLFFLYVFMPVCAVCYFIYNDVRYRNGVLILFSLIFYAWGEPLWISILLVSVTLNYFYGRMLESPRLAKLGVALSLVTSLGLLVAFKYSGFIAENLNLIPGVSLPVPSVTLPIGISFYTFQIISYTLDCYWGKIKVQRNYFSFLMYVSLFPSLVAGPIVRYSVVEKEIAERRASAADISEGIGRFAVGLGKKVLIANHLGVIVDSFFGGDVATLSVAGVWYAVVLYALQVYFDFSGYSDMAIGLGRIFGFRFNENFNYPFISKNITEFWQRWHISLGSFFRDYLLYIPIFGKRRQYVSLFLVWFCTGLWHGASWNYVIWGLYFGAFIFIERKIGNKRMKRIPKPILHVYSKLVIVVGFGIFYFTDIGQLGEFLRGLVGLGGNALVDTVTTTSLVNNIFLVTAGLVLSLPVLPALRKQVEKLKGGAALAGGLQVVGNLALLAVCSIMLVNATNNPFLYFNF